MKGMLGESDAKLLNNCACHAKKKTLLGLCPACSSLQIHPGHAAQRKDIQIRERLSLAE